jgi:hypothetical protein
MMKKRLTLMQNAPLNYGRLFWSASLLSLCLMPACSDDDNDGVEGGDSDGQQEVLSVAQLSVTTDAAQLAQGVTIYRAPQTRAAIVELAFPTAIPEGAVTLTENTTVTEVSGTIVVPQGVTLTINAAEIPSGAVIISNGTILVQGSALAINGDVYAAAGLDLSGIQVTVGGTLYVGGSLTAPSLTVTGQAALGGALISSDVAVNGGVLELNGATRVMGSLSAATSGTVALDGGVVVTVKGDLSTDASARITTKDSKYGYINVDGNLLAADKDLTEVLNGYLAIITRGYKVNGANANKTDLELPATLALGRDEVAALNLNADGTVPSGAATSVTLLQQVARIETAHRDSISATGITVNNGKIYVSWHQRGNGYFGRVEIGQLTSTGLELVQSFETNYTAARTSTNVSQGSENDGKDFNHIYVSGNRLYAVGNEPLGGIIAYVDLNSDGTAANTSLSYRRLWGGDGNCVIRTGDYLQVASTFGYEVYSATNLQRANRDSLSGNGKFIVAASNGIYALRYANSENVATNIVSSENGVASGTTLVGRTYAIDQFATSDYLLENPTTLSYSDVLAPIDGKNTIAVDGSNIYVSRGAYGITRYPDGATFVADTLSSGAASGYANCVAVQGDYVYVANGSAGVYVLNKSDLSVVAKYTNAGGKSANYVTVGSDGHIYVAYGEAGWQVLELVTVQK